MPAAPRTAPRLDSIAPTWIDLDGFRKKRNQNDYLGVAISLEEAEEAIAHAHNLLNVVRAHLLANHQRLLG